MKLSHKQNNKGETLMNSLSELHLESNSKIKINFDGGDLSSDSGLFLIKEFASKTGFEKLINILFKTIDNKAVRQHTDSENLLQKIYQIIAGYFNDNDSDELSNEPVFNTILEKNRLASQPTMSRFLNRMDDETMIQFEDIHASMRDKIYAVKQPEQIILDVDSTNFATYGQQEGNSFNYHYSSYGYHPLLCYDGLTGDLLKSELRNGSIYTSNGVVDFLRPIIEEFEIKYFKTKLYLRGDSGFAVPEMFDLLEDSNVKYAVRLKSNAILKKYASEAEAKLDEITSYNKVDYAVCYDEFLYAASSWEHPRRVVVKAEKPDNQMIYMITFIVTNMSLSAEDVVKYYCNRGTMENFIKESKNGFNFDSMSSHSKLVNANRLQISMLAYNLFNWFKRLVLPVKMRKYQIDTIRLKLIKIASKIVHGARYITFKLCDSFPYKREFCETLNNIQRLMPKLE